MKRWLAVIALATRVAHADPDPAPADPKHAAEDKFAEGQKHFAAGEFLAAADAFEAAYALDADPVYLYNTAQAYRNGSACERAADFYRRFLAVVPNPPNLEKVQRYLHDLDACAKAEAEEHPAPEPQPTVAASKPVVPVPLEHSSLPTLGLIVGGGGLVIAGVGGWFTHEVDKLESYSRALCSDSTTTCQWTASKQARANDLQHRGNRDTAISLVAYGIGGAAVVTGIVMYVLGNRASRERVSFVPARGGGGIVTGFAF